MASSTTGVAASSTGSRADGMHLHVVRVPVAPTRVVRGQDVGVLVAEDAGQPLGRVVDAHAAEAAR